MGDGGLGLVYAEMYQLREALLGVIMERTSDTISADVMLTRRVQTSAAAEPTNSHWFALPVMSL